jgi:hypothetical protein
MNVPTVVIMIVLTLMFAAYLGLRLVSAFIYPNVPAGASSPPA